MPLQRTVLGVTNSVYSPILSIIANPDTMNVFEEIRKEYQSKGLNRIELRNDPKDQFDAWFQEAIDKSPGTWFEANGMTLSTSSQGIVTSRTVLLKEIQDHRFVFFTNYASEKGSQLAGNPRAALLFHWHYLGRQIRINGTVEKTSREISKKYFHSRPRGSQIGALASAQSKPVESRQTLEDACRQLEQQYEGQEVPLPESWGGYALKPLRFEFWQGRNDRLHDRFQYSVESAGGSELPDREEWPTWKIERLSP